jgi:hypothetical protein
MMMMMMMMMSVEQSVEWELAKETEVPGEILPQYHFFHSKSHVTWSGIEPGPPRCEVSVTAWAIGRPQQCLSNSLSVSGSTALVDLGASWGRYLHTKQHRQIINTHRHQYLVWVLNPRSQCSTGRRRLMPQIARPLWSTS